MLTSSIEFDKRGKQYGFLALTHSDHRHAHSIIPIPVIAINRGPGPCALITAGVHGDEYAGVAAVRQLADELTPGEINGSIILLPALNLPAWSDLLRVSPLDGKNLNRVFPGHPDGTPTEQIAHYVEEVLLPRVDFALDLHTGGTTARYLPSTFVYEREDSRMQAKRNAAAAFGAPAGLIVNAPISSGSLSGAFERKGVVGIATEISGGATLEPDAIHLARAGTYRLLKHWDVIKTVPADVPRAAETQFLRFSGDPDNKVIAHMDGLVVPRCNLGDLVNLGDTVAQLYPMDDLSRPKSALKAKRAGIVATMTARSRMSSGDCFCILADPIHSGSNLHGNDYGILS